MRILLNELSYQYVGIKDISVFFEFVEGLKYYSQNNPKIQLQVYTCDERLISNSRSFLNDMTLRDLAHKCPDEISRLILLNLLSNGLIYINDYQDAIYEERNTNRLTASIDPYVKETNDQLPFSISVFSEPHWLHSSIYYKNTENDDIIEIANYPKPDRASVEAYIKAIECFTVSWASSCQPEDHLFLPHKSLSSSVLNNSTFKYIYADAISRPNERLAVFTIVGSFVARVNGYIKDVKISAINSNSGVIRNIFFNNDIKLFISIDYEKGAFEVLDDRGKHIGEYNYHGDKTSDADENGLHDIKLGR